MCTPTFLRPKRGSESTRVRKIDFLLKMQACHSGMFRSYINTSLVEICGVQLHTPVKTSSVKLGSMYDAADVYSTLHEYRGYARYRESDKVR